MQWSLLVLCAMGIVSTEVSAQHESGVAFPNPEHQVAEERPAYLVEFGNAVKAYREGDYIQARKSLHPLHAKHPENSRVTYYLAITEAQLGRFQQAKKLYEEILTLDPNSEAAQLASEGLKFLPAETAMDAPPRFQGQAGSTGNASVSANQQLMTQGNGTQMPSPQEWMALQMMMGQNGLSGTGGMGAMPWMNPGASPMGGNAYGMGSFDPNVMSNMLMNQMMQNFTLSGDKDDNR